MTVEEVPDPADVELLAAALRADSADLETYATVLASSLSEALPAGMVEVDRERSLSDRLAGREGRATAVRVLAGDRSLELQAGRHGQLVARSLQSVRGVVIGRREIPVDAWVRELAQLLADRAKASESARAALARLLQG